MSLGCARCGDCCDPVGFTRAEWGAVTAWSTDSLALNGVPDPRTDEGWETWRRSSEWAAGNRDEAIACWDPDGDRRRNADFIAAHWQPIDDQTARCDAFDPQTRSCTAHSGRPPVCEGYPWYGREPREDTATDFSLASRCSYLLDIPPAGRPEGARPLIPLTVVRSG